MSSNSLSESTAELATQIAAHTTAAGDQVLVAALTHGSGAGTLRSEGWAASWGSIATVTGRTVTKRTRPLRLAKPVPSESGEGGSDGESTDLAGDKNEHSESLMQGRRSSSASRA
jgi:hypothetical protein